MGKVNQIKANYYNRNSRTLKNNFTSKVRLNLNDLLKQRQEERIVDKKTNLIIISGATTLAIVVLIILSF